MAQVKIQFTDLDGKIIKEKVTEIKDGSVLIIQFTEITI